MSDIRPVWLTREQRDHLRRNGFLDPKLHTIVAAWDAAPADATEAAILGTMLPNYTENDRAFVTPIVLNVLRALGMP